MSDIKAIQDYFKLFEGNEEKLRNSMYNKTGITKEYISDYMNWSEEMTREVISKLLQNGMLEEVVPSLYVKTPEFYLWLNGG